MNKFLSLFLMLSCCSLLFGQKQSSAKENIKFIAITDLNPQGIDSPTSMVITERLRTEVFKTGAFNVLERSQMKVILEEQEFQQSDCVSDECLVQAGQLLGVTHIIAGALGKVGKTYTINLRMIDVGSGKIVYTDYSDCKCDVDEVLSRTTSKIAKKLANSIRGKKRTTSSIATKNKAGGRPKNQSLKRIAQLAFGAITISGIMAGLYLHLKTQDQIDKTNNIYSAYQAAPANADFNNFKKQYNDTRNDANNTTLRRNVSLGVAVLGAAGFMVTFAF